MKKLKNKKSLLFGGVLCVSLAVLAITIAYNRDSSILANTFTQGIYRTIVTEEFTSPDNWKPCDETPKTVKIRNDGNVDVEARLKYREYWAGGVGDHTLEYNGVRLANIVFQNENDWELRADGYYYYKDVLAPGEETSSLFEKVVFNCEANIAINNVCTETATGVVCENPENYDRTMMGWDSENGSYTIHEYGYEDLNGAEYHLNITAETVQADAVYYWHSLDWAIADQAKDLPDNYTIDYTQNAKTADRGVLKATENGNQIYYYRGSISNNNVVWADMCWQIIRTTSTGGIKMIYNGLPTSTTVDGRTQLQCLASGSGKTISYNSTKNFKYNNSNTQLASIGYMFDETGEIQSKSVNNDSADTTEYVFSKGISNNNGTYTLDTSEGQSVTAKLGEKEVYDNAYHYFCTDGSSSCDSTKAAYLFYYSGNLSASIGMVVGGVMHSYYYPMTVYYVLLNGSSNYAQLKGAIETNTSNSGLKAATDGWFVSSGLSAHEDELEDAIYCNDRRSDDNALKADTYGSLSQNTHFIYNSIQSTYAYATQYAPSLDCLKNDSFTKTDSTNGNAKMQYKVGHLTSAEASMAGFFYYNMGGVARPNNSDSYLKGSATFWTVSPSNYNEMFVGSNNNLGMASPSAQNGIRPVVALKKNQQFVSGDGTANNPYVIE